VRLPLSILVVAVLAACGPKEPPPPAAEAQAPTDQPAEAAWSAERATELLDQSVSLLLKGTPEAAKKALTKLDKIVENEPDMVEAIYNQGLAHQLAGEPKKAERRFLRATDISPEFAPAWQNLGALAEREGTLQAALGHYRAGLRTSPDDGALQVGEIRVLRKLGRLDEAIQKSRTAIRTNGDNIGAYNNLGLIYLAQGKLELAQFVYERAEQTVIGAKDDPLIEANLGRVYLAQEKKGAAREKFQRAIALDEKLVAPRLGLASLYMDDRDWDSTVETLTPALALDPTNPAIHVNLGIAYRGQGRFEDSIKAYNKALELDPSQLDIYLNLALVYGDSLSAFDDAIKALDTYQSKGGARSELVAERRKEIEVQKKRYERALKRKQRAEENRRRREEDAKLAAAAEERLRKQKEEEARQATQEAPAPPPPPGGGASGGGEPSPDSAGAAAPSPAPPAPPANSASLGNPCSGLGQCGDPALECAHDSVCREVGTAGTFQAGVGCMQDTDCAFGLSCTNNQCAEASAGPTPWGN
jgi:tetratricopeptide (TPR) repeat protein